MEKALRHDAEGISEYTPVNFTLQIQPCSLPGILQYPDRSGKFYVIGKTAFASADEAAARAAAGDSVHIRSAALQTLGTGI